MNKVCFLFFCWTVSLVTARCFSPPRSAPDVSLTAEWTARHPVIVKAALIGLETDNRANIKIHEIYKGELRFLYLQEKSGYFYFKITIFQKNSTVNTILKLRDGFKQTEHMEQSPSQEPF